ncbi:kinase-like protein [Gigaspora margarita]|uniref:Kinase-like protein n=1 Tax=Gigaspora margarita TaxID=4874 RepID=A0A8H4AFT7_GIGMA|nr:kinase-like protein [Gigaspora margarita]
MRKSSTRNKGFEKTLIKDDEITKYDYSECKNIRAIEKGGFSTVYSAVYEGKKIALKSLDSEEENKEASKEFIKELKQLLAITSFPNINKFHGITQDPKTNKFMLVLQFANGGNLRQHLYKKWHENTFKISLDEIIDFAKQITIGLEHLHNNDIIHCDLHSKNILINDGELLIADFGLSKKLDDTYNSTASMIKGMPAYLDPDFHQEPGKKPDKKSDIYSLGVLFWELTSGVPPFANAINTLAILIQTLKGYREQPIPGTPIDYAKLYKKCWNAKPNERPTISQIHDNLNLISETNAIKYITNCNKQLIPELDNNVHNEEDDLTKTLLKEASVQKTRRPSCSSSKTSESSITKSSNGTSGRTLSFSKPDHPFALRSRGETHYILEHYEDSLNDLNRSLEIEIDNATARRLRGEIHYISERYDEAINDLTESQRLDPKNATTLRALGQTYFKKEEYKEALENLDKSLKLDHKNAITLEFIGRTQYKLGNYEDSRENLTKSLNINSENSNALRTRGQALYMLGNCEHSLKDLDRALELDPNDPEALRARGKVYYSLKKYDESLENLTKSLDLEPEHPFALRSRGTTHFMLNNYEDSLADLNNSLDLEPDNVEALRSRAKTYAKLGRNEELQADLDKILSIEEQKRKEDYLNSLKKSLNI